MKTTVQLPINIENAPKREVRSQFAALVYRVKDGKIQFLLITSRRSGRWIIPKGWPMLGIRPAKGAAQEAWEEAGVVGKVSDQCQGIFSYYKRGPDEEMLPCLAMVYPLRAKRLSKSFPEAGQRKRKWYSRKKAAKLVDEPELAKIIKSFDPRSLH
ncbi:NUDIX hydrolase [Cognatishimia sp. 1_MG-2023]|uniref:NUDIX hydrolase n=1 Tax=Cognatishimia sp. 1_MG-2023 TaxID=3062642 RepID=UPI0026E186DB|nr:NUDIX hydrolase [Cognatishimia sp. 1_MG-2023]MDO6725646.1 NUDIX hydrolase [Cognatishimia sp. 1_MG-2023]